MRRARRENDQVVVSIFVNPLQFGPKEDFKQYPRTLKHDLALLKQERVDIVFVPSATQMVPLEPSTTVDVSDQVIEEPEAPWAEIEPV